jgi:hypothetical protein
MTDLSPNDLSHLSDEQFNALAPQGYHATGQAKPLSPAAQSVLDAFLADWADNPLSQDRQCLAAALRAAVDGCDSNWLATTAFHHLYAIADELKIFTTENR